MLVVHLRRRPNFKTTMIQRLHDSYVMSEVNASAHWGGGGKLPSLMTLFIENWTVSTDSPIKKTIYLDCVEAIVYMIGILIYILVIAKIYLYLFLFWKNIYYLMIHEGWMMLNRLNECICLFVSW